MDVASIADVLAKNVPLFADSPGELHLTPSHETEWHQVYFADDGRHKVVVSIPSWSGTDLYSKTLAEEALSGLGPRHIATLVHGSNILLVNEFFDGGTLKTEDLTSDTLARVGSLYARLHKADVSWFQPVCDKLAADGVLAKSESDWAFCLWVFPRLLGALAAGRFRSPKFQSWSGSDMFRPGFDFLAEATFPENTCSEPRYFVPT